MEVARRAAIVRRLSEIDAALAGGAYDAATLRRWFAWIDRARRYEVECTLPVTMRLGAAMGATLPAVPIRVDSILPFRSRRVSRAALPSTWPLAAIIGRWWSWAGRRTASGSLLTVGTGCRRRWCWGWKPYRRRSPCMPALGAGTTAGVGRGVAGPGIPLNPSFKMNVKRYSVLQRPPTRSP